MTNGPKTSKTSTVKITTTPSTTIDNWYNQTTTTGTSNPWVLNGQGVTNTGMFIPSYSISPSKIASPRRETAIVEENWIPLDDWYICSRSIAEKREGAEWLEKSQLWNKRLAHKCENGRVRAPTGFRFNEAKKTIFGRCSGCSEPLSQSVKAFILLEESNI